MIDLLKNNKLVVAGVLLGALGGWLYWNFVGCYSGSCAITSKPVNSSVYGAMMGGLFFSLFKPGKKSDEEKLS